MEYYITDVLLLNYKYSDSINGANLLMGNNRRELENNPIVISDLRRETFDGRYQVNTNARFIGIQQPNKDGNVK